MSSVITPGPLALVFAEDAAQMGIAIPWCRRFDDLGLRHQFGFFTECDFDVFDRSYDSRRHAGELISAVEAFRAALDKEPGDPALEFNIGYAKFHLRDYDEALRAFESVLHRVPDSQGFVSVWIGNTFLMKDFRYASEALRWFDKAIRENRLWPYAHYRMAVGNRELGRLKDAYSMVAECLRLDPSFPYAYYEMGNILLREKRPEEAVDAFAKALQLRPMLGAARYQLGAALACTGATGRARKHYLAMVEEFPRNPFGYIGVANTCLLMGDQAGAAWWLRRALELDPDNPQANCNLASIRLHWGDFGEAEECYRKALRSEPGDPWITYNLARTLARAGRDDEARQVAAAAIRYSGCHPRAEGVGEKARELLERLSGQAGSPVGKPGEESANGARGD